jgi:choline dehydrogenase-like flavoprotein
VVDHPHAHQGAQQGALPPMKTYRPSDEVDFVVVGSGAAGGVMARELAQAGFSVVVLEQGPWLTEKDFKHDEIWVNDRSGLTNDHNLQPNTIRQKDSDTARKEGWATYGRVVGGGSVHFTANFWRFPELEFEQASRFGVPTGSSVADWPIKYADLEPYYTKVEWEIGVSGLAGNPFEPPRSKPFPMPPLPIKSEGVLMERGARKLGWHPWPAPMAIASQPYRGRSGCLACGFCYGFGCEARAKSSTLVAMVPYALATGRCEIRPLSYVRKVESGPSGRVTGVRYFDKDRKEIFQRAKAVVLSANGAETPKLLLMSSTNAFPAGLANSSGMVGRNIMFNGAGISGAMFDHEINAWKGAVVSRVTWDQYILPKELGIYGGGGFDLRGSIQPIGGGFQTPPGAPSWGREWKRGLKDGFSKTLAAFGHTTQLPVASNIVDLDPTEKDAWGLPVPRLTFVEHENDGRLQRWFMQRGRELLDAAGAAQSFEAYAGPSVGGPHLLGTCRMGNDPKTSVVDADHRAHDVKNLFMVDGSSFVTSGRGQPTMTIQALAFRAADRIAKLAKTGSI